MQRDFTYIDDIVEGVARVLDHVAAPQIDMDMTHPDPSSSHAPYHLYNIGSHQPVGLMKFIETLEDALGRKAVKNMLPMQPGDVPATYADIEDLQKMVGFTPRTSLHDGIARYVAWFRSYYGLRDFTTHGQN